MRDLLQTMVLKLQTTSKTFQFSFWKMIPFLNVQRFQQIASQMQPSLPTFTFLSLQKEYQPNKLPLKLSTKSIKFKEHLQGTYMLSNQYVFTLIIRVESTTCLLNPIE